MPCREVDGLRVLQYSHDNYRVRSAEVEFAASAEGPWQGAWTAALQDWCFDDDVWEDVAPPVNHHDDLGKPRAAQNLTDYPPVAYVYLTPPTCHR